MSDVEWSRAGESALAGGAGPASARVSGGVEQMIDAGSTPGIAAGFTAKPEGGRGDHEHRRRTILAMRGDHDASPR